MSINIESTTDSAELVAAALAEPKKVETVEKPAAAAKTPEKLETSGASNDEEIETEEEKESKAAADKTADGKKRNNVEKKIGKLTKQRESARLEAEYWRAEAMKNASKPAEKTPEKIEAKPSTLAIGEPDPDKFEDHKEYIKAVARWEYSESKKADEAKTRETALKTEGQKQSEKLKSSITSFKETHKDFDEIIESVEDIPMPIPLQLALLESDNSAQLMYELSKNREEYEKICALPAQQMARALGRFEAKLEAPAPSAEKPAIKTSKAPAPIVPLGSNATGAGKKRLDDPNLTQREYEQLRAEQIKAQRA